MSSRRRLDKAVGRLDLTKSDRTSYIPGELGLEIGGEQRVEVDGRPGYVYVRLRSQLSETIQAYNSVTSPIYDLPVLVARDELDPTRYRVVERDLSRYAEWGRSSFIPNHGNQHSFNPPDGGGDVVFVYPQQMMPALVHPSGSAGAASAIIREHTYFANAEWRYLGTTGTPSFLDYKPTGTTTARMVLVYVDNNENPVLLAGSEFDAALTGTQAVLPFVPDPPSDSIFPAAAVRLVTGTQSILWENIYDVRPWIVGRPAPTTFRSYSASTQGLGANPDIFVGGYYEWSTADANLTQASTTQTFGSSNVAYASHAFAVFGGSGTVTAGSGVVGLRVNGTSINDSGTRTTGDSQVLAEDITLLQLDQFLETPKKWLGQITFELYASSGSPTTYGLDFNYGLNKYDDLGNRDFILTDVEAVGYAGANDSNFDVQLIHQRITGWTYAATGFDPVTEANKIASLVEDHSTDDQLANSAHFAWKRDNLNRTILGSGDEGFLIRVTSSANNAVQYVNVHIGAKLL